MGNVRENSMLHDVLPSLQTFLSTHCTDILQLPILEIIYSHYIGDGLHDVFVLENLQSAGFAAFNTGDLDESHLKSCLECLAQLHGTGLAFKQNLGGGDEVLKQFP